MNMPNGGLDLTTIVNTMHRVLQMWNDMAREKPYPITAVAKTFRILEKLANEEELGINRLSDALNIPKSTVYKHLRTLVELGYVEKQDGLYSISYRMAKFTSGFREEESFFRLVLPEIERIADTCNDMAGFYLLRGRVGRDMYAERGSQVSAEFVFQNAPDLHCNAPGKAILSELPPATAKRVLNGFPLDKKTDNTIVTRGKLMREIKSIKERGVAFDRQEQQIGVKGVAVPLQIDDFYAAVYIVGHSDRMTGKRFEEQLPGLVNSAKNTIVRQRQG